MMLYGDMVYIVLNNNDAHYQGAGASLPGSKHRVRQLKETEKEMRQAAEQAKIYDNSLSLINRTIKKNELTMKQLDKLTGNRSIYVPIGRAYPSIHSASSRRTRSRPSRTSRRPTIS
jgi:hypothetical protein